MRTDGRHNNTLLIHTQTYNFYAKPVPALPGAACRDAGIDPDMFYPYPKRLDRATLKVVKSICGKCPVQLECLEYAMENDEEFGIWGGLTRKQRISLKQSRKTNAQSNTTLVPGQYSTPNWRGTQATV